VNLATLPANADFLEAVARRWLDLGVPQGEGLILLPTRRAARSLADAFLRVSEGRPMLLPRITALGALDEAALALVGALDLPPAVDEAVRLAELARLILALPTHAGGVAHADQAWLLARELAKLMDEAERAEIGDFPSALARAAEGALAEHWDITLRFLDIVTRQWPLWLGEQGLINPQARRVQLLRAQARAWHDTPPATPVWAAGATGGIKSVANLLRVVARLPNGMVILPGLDETPPQNATESHPQAGLLDLLAGMGAAPGDVARWEAPARAPNGRVALLHRALLPAEALGEWREPATLDTTGLLRLEPADQQEEAVAIALILRDALEQPGTRAALVTPDRPLATRVAAELLRWGVVADDSAGEPLAHTPQAVFLRLLAEAVLSGLAPAALLAVLKHPLAAAGMSPLECRTAARALERGALRGPKPPPGITGLRLATEAVPGVQDFLTRLEDCLAPLLRLQATAAAIAPKRQLEALIEAAEAIATTGDTAGPSRLWAQEEGEVLAETLASALDALTRLPDQPFTILPGLLDAQLEGIAVRSRRALRGRDTAFEHPRVFIWGLLEARLQSVDVIVVGGLAETIWPPATDPGPWMSRPMRKAAGLPSPEEAVGQSAHDVVMAACSAPIAVLSCPRRRDGAPAVPARWLARLDACLAGQASALPKHPATGWARLLDQPEGSARPVRPPAPKPPVALRPRRLSVTEIETWSADPYAIYAKHILKLHKLKPLEEATDAADYGSIVHKGFQIFLQGSGLRWNQGWQALLRESMRLALEQANLRRALNEWWEPRLIRIADWVFVTERDRDGAHPPIAIGAELRGKLIVNSESGFTLTGQADRIERFADGTLAILDYKTGAPPPKSRVASGAAPQLTLEAAMAARGAFGPEWAGPTSELVYWHVSGGHEPGKATPLFDGNATAIAEAADEALNRLRDRIIAFNDEDCAYLAQPHPGLRPRFPEFAQLARVDEWDLEEGE
jgi:ATP-dependent helicase/nuclease subunit B